MDQKIKTQNNQNFDENQAQSQTNAELQNQNFDENQKISNNVPFENFDTKVARHEAQKVINLKYKTFIVLIFIFCWFWFGNFQDSIKEVNWLKGEEIILKEKIAQISLEADQIKKNLEMIEYVNKNNENVINCINNQWIKCKDDKIKNVQEIRNYLLMSQNTSMKMDFDQKNILANIDKHLLPLNNGTNGNIEIITFAAAQPVDKSLWLYKLPITLSINFTDDKSLLVFIQNIERKIFNENPMLYKIVSVNYDVAKYQENQDVEIVLEAYFYK